MDKSGCAETNRASDGHSLPESTSGGVSQGTERANEGHSLPGERIRKDKSVHGNKQSERRVPTNWRSQREARVTTRKETEQVRGTHGLERRRRYKSVQGNKPSERGTHKLESVEEGTSQDTETNRASEGNSLPGEHKGRDKSGHGNKLSGRAALTLWRVHRER